MRIGKNIFKPRYIVLFIMLATVCLLFKTWKCYVFYDAEGDSTTYFTDSQIKDLNKTDARLAMVPINVIQRKSSSLAFFTFSFTDFKMLKINSVDVIYDGKRKTFRYDIVYDMDFENPNFAKVITYEIDGTTVQGYKKMTVPGFMNFEPCWADFYDLFKWKHNRLGDEFDVQVIVNYNLDDRLYNQKLNYKVRCEKAYPPNLFKCIFFNKKNEAFRER